MESIAPVVEGTVTIDGASVTLLGIDLFAEQGIRNFTGEAEATAADAPDTETLFRGFPDPARCRDDR